MGRPRITIAQIILAVGVCAVGLAAIRSGSDRWAGALFSITFFVMICSLLGVALERGMWRTYWIGFATLGWSYLLLVYGPWLDGRIGLHLLSPSLFGYLAELLDPDRPAGGGGFQSVPLATLGATTPAGGLGFGPPRNLDEYRQIGASLEALLWAFVGGWVACFFATRRDRSDDPNRVPPAAGAPTGGPGA